MIRKVFKNRKPNAKIHALLNKYNIPKHYFSVNRKMVANAMFVGLFFAMIPMPMQMLAVILTLSIIKFNVPIAVSLVWITNPLTMPFIFYGEYTLGNLFFTQEAVPIQMTIEWFQNNLDSIFMPLYLGALITAFVLAFTSRYLVNHLWKRSVKNEKRNKETKT